jgi:hypothetical protein
LTTAGLVSADVDGAPDLYERVGGTYTLLSTGPTDPHSASSGSVFCTRDGASADGLSVIFASLAPLVAADTDSSVDVYERSGGQTTLVSVGPNGGNAQIQADLSCAPSSDASHIFFQTAESLVVEDTNTANDIYERTGGQTVLVSTGPGPKTGDPGANCLGTTADGLHAYIQTAQALVAADQDLTSDIYERTGGQTILVSDAAPGLDDDVNVGFVQNGVAREANSFVFTVAEPLVASDTDDQTDLYEWNGQRLRLVSTGPTGGNGEFFASPGSPTPISADGSTILFSTQEALVAADSGSNYDLYAARAVASDDETQTVGPGGTASTGSTPTPADPVETSVTTPDGGDVTIVEEESGTPPAGYELAGMQVVITAPPATAPDSLELRFLLDGSLLAPLGLDHASVVILKDGAAVADCSTTVPADPDPCVASRSPLPGGGADLIVRTTTVSTWQFGEPVSPSDSTPPVITPSVTGTLGLNGWYTSNVGVSWTVTDPESAISSTSGCDPTTISADSTGTTLTCQATSGGGTASSPITIKRDGTAPTLTCQAAAFVLGSAGGQVSATVTDGTSGPASSSVSGPANVTSAGVKSVSLTASDLAGNQSTSSCGYVVRYGFPGFTSPTAGATSKPGSTIPVRFALTNAAGTPISDASAQALANACGVRISFTAGDPANACASYNAKADRFEFDLKTTKSMTGQQTITVRVFVGSGLVNIETISIRLR